MCSTTCVLAASIGNLASHGGSSKGSLDAINGLSASVPANQLGDLSTDPDIAYVSPDRPVQRYLSNTAPAVDAGYSWALGFDGTGIGVAVIDSGIQDSSTVATSGSSKKSHASILQTSLTQAGLPG